MANNIFAPPTAQELSAAKSQSNLFAAPSQDELTKFNVRQPQNEQAFDFSKIPKEVLHVVGQAFDRMGPAQFRNALAGTIGMKPDNVQAYVEDLTGSNSPSFGEILDYAKVPSAEIVDQADGYADNLKDFKTSPEVSPQEQEQLKTVKTGINTNDVLGAVMDFETQGQVFNNLGKLSKGVKNLSQSTGNAAEKMAENATGATGLQASKFSDNAGRELLDKKVVSFGNNQEQIANKAADQVAIAENQIDSALKALDQKGVKVSVSPILDKIQARITELSKNASKADVVKELNKISDNIVNTGEEFITPQLGEETKRGFNKIAKDWTNPKAGEAGKIAYRVYKDAVEEAAKSSSPEISSIFQEGKKTFGTMAPIEEAAVRRSMVTKQSPYGGLLDTATAGAAGAAAGGPIGVVTGIMAATARRAIAPRLASSGAVTLDAVSKALSGLPKYSGLASTNQKVFTSLANKVYEQINNPDQNENVQLKPTLATKGPAKWQLDGAKKLIDSGIPQEQIDKLKLDKKGQDLLVQAASGDKSLKSVVDKLKADNPSKTFPMTVTNKKTNHIATVFDEADLRHANQLGFE